MPNPLGLLKDPKALETLTSFPMVLLLVRILLLFDLLSKPILLTAGDQSWSLSGLTLNPVRTVACVLTILIFHRAILPLFLTICSALAGIFLFGVRWIHDKEPEPSFN